MKRRILSLLVCLTMVLTMIPMTAFADTNSRADLEISSAADLQAFATAVNEGDNFKGKTVRLTADIDLASIQWQPIGGDSVYFAGEFDGNGKTISNLTNTEDTSRKGLFGLVEKCYIHDLTLENVKFSGNTTGARIGALAGNLQYYNVIENVTVDGLDYDLNDTNGLIGGLVGYSWTSYVKNCTVKNADMSISSTGDSAVGTMIAYGRGVGDARTNFPYADKIEAADYQGESVWNYVDSKVEGAKINLSGTVSFGGFLGADTYNSWRNYAKNCTVTGLDVTCAAVDGVYTVGGFMGGQYGGYDPAAIKDCSVTGKITSEGTNPASTFGGFMGYKGGRPGGATGCTSNVTIDVAAGDVGGFVAETQQYFAHEYKFDSCESTGNVSTDNGNAGGFIANIQHGGDGNALNVVITDSKATGTATTENGTAGSFAGTVNDEKNGNATGGDVVLENIVAKGEGSIVGDAPENNDNFDFDVVVMYEIIEGGKQTVTKGEAASFTSDASFDKFVEVKIGDKTLAPENYTAVEGSTKVTLNADYTNTLEAGNEYKITIVSEDGEASTSFAVAEKAPEQTPPAGGDSGNGTTPTDKPAGEAQDKGNAQTGDDFNMAIPFMLALMALVGMGAAVVARKRNTN